MASLSRIFELTTGLLDIEDVGTLLRQIASSVKELFGFSKVSISILQPGEGIFADHALAGYTPEEEAEIIKSRELFEVGAVLADFREDCRISRIGYYIPAEKQDSGIDGFAVVQDKAAALAPRKSPDAWHELDLLYFSLYDRKGAMIGYLQADYPLDGKIPSKETIEEIELFATIAAVGIESSNQYERTLELLQENEMKTERISRILDLIRSVLRLDEVDVILKKIAETLAMTFGFKKTSVSLFTPGTDRITHHALTGYTNEEEARVRDSVILKSKVLEDLKEEFRVTKTGYFIPAESQKDPSDFVFMENPKEAKQKRKSPDSYHEMDLLYFGVYDREGRMIGYIQPDYPINGKIPTKEAMESMEAFASVVSIAIENSSLYAAMTDAEKQTKMYLDLITHDVGNLVGPIDAYLELLMGSTPLTDKQQKYLSSALEAVRSTSHLIRNVRRSAQMMDKDLEIVPVNLTRSIKQTSSDAKAAALHRKVDIRLKMPDRDVWVLADNLLDEVFYNLLTNAIRYDEHEEVFIEVEVEVVEVEGRRSAKVSIADHAIGIPDELKGKIFIRGFKDLIRQDRPVLQKSKGAGMGLSLVKALVDRYEGKIWIENREYDDYTRGSIFTVLLPKP